MTFEAAMKELRDILRDELEPYGWNEKRLEGYLDEGQDKLCEDTGLFLDATTATIVTVPGTAVYAVPGRLIEIYSAWTSDRVLRVFDDNYITDQMTLSTEQGPPCYYEMDYVAGMIRLYPIPDAVQTIQLRVWRYPLAAASVSGAFEVPERFQRACIEWAAFKALSVHDAELGDPKKAMEHKMEYRNYALEAKRSVDRIQSRRTEFAPSPVYVV